MKTAGLLLAAGHGHRFGAGNKLLAPFRGRPLLTHAADAMRDAGLAALFAAVRDDAVAALLDGFSLSRLPRDRRDQSASLAAVCRDCLASQPDRLLIVLADMPHVTSAHLRAVVQACRDDRPSASSNGLACMPPACFPASQASALMALHGDSGAGAMLKALPQEALVMAPAAMLKDVDHLADLE